MSGRGLFRCTPRNKRATSSGIVSIERTVPSDVIPAVYTESRSNSIAKTSSIAAGGQAASTIADSPMMSGTASSLPRAIIISGDATSFMARDM